MGTWRNLTNAVRKIYNYSWVYWTPFGNAIVVGPNPTTSYLDISGTGAWTIVDIVQFPRHPGLRLVGHVHPVAKF